MPVSYDDAVAELYRAAHDAFVAERKRLAGELKTAGDKQGAARLSKLGRPPISAWAVNQLWWQAREPFERLFAAAAKLRANDQSGASDRRDALASLKSRAAALLVEAGHAVSEGTLRRVTTTLSALAASGSFEPDPPGALSADRDPPGFDLAGLGGFAAAAGGATPVAESRARTSDAAVARELAASPSTAKKSDAEERADAERAEPAAGVPAERAAAVEKPRADKARAVHAHTEPADAERERIERERIERERAAREQVERERAEADRVAREREERELNERLLAEQRRLEVERAARRAERERLEQGLPALRSDLERREREVERLRAELARVESLAAQARSAIQAAETRLGELAEGTD